MINARFRVFLSARAISFVGDGASATALLLYVQQRTENGLSVGALVAAATLPRLVAPLAGTLADRTDQRLLMIRTDLGQAAAFLCIAVFLPPLPLLLALVAVASLLAGLGRPASSSLVPRLVGPDELLRANAWVGIALNLQIAFGPALGAGMFTALGVRGALVVNAATFLASALLLRRLTVSPADPLQAQSFIADFKEGIALVFRDRLLRTIVITLFLGVLFAAVDNVALVFLVRDELHASSLAYGIVATSFGIGMVALAVALTRVQAEQPFALYMGGLVVNGVGMVATGFATGTWMAGSMQGVAGAGNAAINVGGDTLIQRHAPPAMMGRAFGLVATAAVFGGGLAALIGGGLVVLVGARTTFVIGGLGILASAALGGVMTLSALRGHSNRPSCKGACGGKAAAP